MMPHRYILTRRVAHALELLREGRLRVAEVANASEFTDQSYMRHCLRLLCSPPVAQHPPHKNTKNKSAKNTGNLFPTQL
jgi:transcriptional regulator GlxA family with amidase domain